MNKQFLKASLFLMFAWGITRYVPLTCKFNLCPNFMCVSVFVSVWSDVRSSGSRMNVKSFYVVSESLRVLSTVGLMLVSFKTLLPCWPLETKQMRSLKQKKAKWHLWRIRWKVFWPWIIDWMQHSEFLLISYHSWPYLLAFFSDFEMGEEVRRTEDLFGNYQYKPQYDIC